MIETLVRCVIYLIVAGLVFWLVDWLITYCGVPDPFRKAARVLLAVFAVLVVIAVLLSLVGVRL